MFQFPSHSRRLGGTLALVGLLTFGMSGAWAQTPPPTTTNGPKPIEIPVPQPSPPHDVIVVHEIPLATAAGVCVFGVGQYTFQMACLPTTDPAPAPTTTTAPPAATAPTATAPTTTATR
jgi:hypothetical protein